MSTVPSLSNELRDLYAGESARIRREFLEQGDGHSAVRQRADLLDRVLLRLWKKWLAVATVPNRCALVAIGGYGRRRLFPYSDVDLLFLHAERASEERLKDPIRSFSQELWDLGIKLSPQNRSLAECDRFDPNNVEFTISLLDCRYLAGPEELFSRLHDVYIPKLVMREAQVLVQRLGEITRSRHARYGNTVFHLEPSVKDGPGGLRDYNVAHWLAFISAMDKLRDWPQPGALLPASLRKQVETASDFLMSVRCFLHLRHNRDDNSLSWSAQDEAAARRIGVADSGELSPADWMRLYFSQARP